MTADGTARTDAEEAWNALMRQFGYDCEECGAPQGMMGTVSCSSCGYIPEGARA